MFSGFTTSFDLHSFTPILRICFRSQQNLFGSHIFGFWNIFGTAGEPSGPLLERHCWLTAEKMQPAQLLRNALGLLNLFPVKPHLL